MKHTVEKFISKAEASYDKMIAALPVYKDTVRFACNSDKMIRMIIKLVLCIFFCSEIRFFSLKFQEANLFTDWALLLSEAGEI